MIIPRKQIHERWRDIPSILKDAVNSVPLIEGVDEISRKFHLNDEKSFVLFRLVRYVFLGFTHTEDFFQELRNSLGIDSRLALEIYHETDKKIFLPFKREIEENYLTYKIGVARSPDIMETAPVSSRIMLKDQSAQTVNLKESGPPKTDERKPLSMNELLEGAEDEVNQKKTRDEALRPSSSPASDSVSSPSPEKKDFSIPGGPVIIHKKEETASVGEVTKSAPFRQTAFGGFFGSFRSPMQKTPAPTPKAEIEIPFLQRIKKTEEKKEEGKIPVSVKKFAPSPAPAAKTVHYSNLKTPLSPKEVSSPEKENGGTVDLGNFTLKK